MINIGKIVKPQGIKGEIKIIVDGEAERFKNLRHVFVSEKLHEIETISVRDGALFVKFRDIFSRNDAEELRNLDVFCDENELEQLSENEFYFKDLIGKKIVDENGNLVGEIIDIDQFGSADVIYIRERNIIFSVPFIDSIFKAIDVDKIVIIKDAYDNMKISD
ncbi:MAG: ribosome maturation factor RimM [Christensenellales bacterium]